ATRGDVRRRVVSALIYPAMVLCFALGLAAFVAVAILPQFAGIVEEFELEVPFSTELLFRTAAVLPKAALVVGVGLLVTLLLWAIAPLRGVLQWLATGVPLLGTLWVWVSHHALCEQLSAYLAAGAPLPAALRGSAAALGNRSLAAAVAKAAVRCEQGETLSAAFADSIHIERMLTTTVRWGEHRGNLPGAIGEAAESYRQQIEDYLSFIRSVAGPCLLVTIGGVTGFTLSALMQPLLGLLRGLSG
ncbi:MAG: type II secretion system F family protein, partial [Planctomycetota bacterium]